MDSRPIFHHNVPTSLANWKEESKVDTAIGKLWLDSSKKSLSTESEPFSETFMPNCLGPPRLTPIVRRKKLVLQEPNSSSDRSLSPETRRLNGSPYGKILNILTLGPPPSPETTTSYPLTYEWSIIGPFGLLALILQRLEEWNVNVWSSGERQVVENLDVPGKKLVWKLILRIPVQSFGAVMMAKKMLSSMNFEEALTFPIFYDGRTDIRSEWNLKEVQDL